MTARELYACWLGSDYTPGDITYFWDLLDSGELASWERLAAAVNTELQRARNDGIMECSEALEDAWERRERRRCPYTT